MFKSFIYFVLILLIAGCSTKKIEDRPPLWYTNPPKDYNFIYATASSNTLQSARNIAVLSINKDLNSKILDAIKAPDAALHVQDDADYNMLFDTSLAITKKLVFHGIKTLKDAEYHSEQLILISIARDALFEEEKSKLDAVYLPLKKEFETIDTISPIEQYAKLNLITSALNEIAIRAELLQIVLNGYDAGEYLSFVNQLKDKTKEINNSIAVRILGDVNSLPFVKPVEIGLLDKELYITRTLDRGNSYNIFLTTDIDKKMDYQFYKTTLTAKIITATKDKKIISTKMHTFIGKSRKGYADAKLQAESGFIKKVKSFGVFEFLGLIKK
ncbi:hypothetical protein KKA17_05265 [bacterium]|nr:hypothetical protein [bacterium]MBU1882693.1 hypothetical protein [bacterium]